MSSEDLKSSAQVWGADVTTRSRATPLSQPSGSLSTPTDLPPSYTNVVEEVAAEPRRHLNPIQELSLLSAIKFGDYDIPFTEVSEDRASTTTSHQLLYTSPTALSNLICQQSVLPPRPILHIKGTHADNNRVVQTDFDLTLNLTTLLDISPKSSSSSRLRITSPPPEPQPKRNAILKRPAAPSPPPLDAWCKLFTSDKSENKSLTLIRLVLDFPASYLEGTIRTLLHTLKYRGKLDISFHIQNQSVTVHKVPGNWFYNMLRLYPVKEYKIAESVWEVRGADDGTNQQIVEEWWDEWKGPIANAVLNKHQARVGVEEWMEWKMGVREKEKKGEWAVDGQWEWAAGS